MPESANKVRIGRASKYPGCNESEHTSSLVTRKLHQSSLCESGEDSNADPKPADGRSIGDGVPVATRIQSGSSDTGETLLTIPRNRDKKVSHITEEGNWLKGERESYGVHSSDEGKTT
jgi:hypothetical protein